MHDHRTHGRDEHQHLIAAFAAWDSGSGPTPGLHVGDLGWALRETDLSPTHAWWTGGRLDAVALMEGPLVRVRVDPTQADDDDLAGVVADAVEAIAAPQVWVEVTGAALDRRLRVGGWVDDDDPWACLYAELGSTPVSDERPDLARDVVADRVVVQRAGFENSTFTEEKWRLMSAGPAYHPELDVVVRATDGQAAAVATAWLSVPGGTAILEPVATHRDHRARGHGRRAVHAACEAARRHGASGISVFTPLHNEAAVAAYLGSGFAQVATRNDLTRTAVES